MIRYKITTVKHTLDIWLLPIECSFNRINLTNMVPPQITDILIEIDHPWSQITCKEIIFLHPLAPQEICSTFSVAESVYLLVSHLLNLKDRIYR